jgi:hypothetical protein
MHHHCGCGLGTRETHYNLSGNCKKRLTRIIKPGIYETGNTFIKKMPLIFFA